MHTITFFFFFFFNDTATTEIYTLSLHDALPISLPADGPLRPAVADDRVRQNGVRGGDERVAPLLIGDRLDRKSTRLNSSHSQISYAVFCLKKKKKDNSIEHTYTLRTYTTDARNI